MIAKDWTWCVFRLNCEIVVLFSPFCKNVKERQEKYSFLLLERIACLLFPEESLILENIFFAKRNGFSKKSLVDFPGAYHFSQINSIATFFVYFSGICLNFIHLQKPQKPRLSKKYVTVIFLVHRHCFWY